MVLTFFHRFLRLIGRSPLGGSALENPWVHFTFFVLINASLSWISVSFNIRLWFILMGLVFLFFLTLRNDGAPDHDPLWKKESFSRIPLWFLIALFAVAVFFRLYKITSLPIWPMIDEGTVSFFAYYLNREWHWNIFFSFNFIPAGFIWLLAVFYKILNPSLFSLWLFPIFVSLATLIVGYLACRQFFSKFFSFIWTLLWAVSFWPLYISRFNESPILTPLWECLCLFLLGHILKATSISAQLCRFLYLGIVLGLGFYINILSIPIFGMIAIALFFIIKSIHQAKHRLALVSAILFPVFIISLPLLLTRLSLPPNDYIKSIWAFQRGFSWPNYIETSLSNLTSVFWGASSSIDYFAYKPLWGGFFNPILGAFFFIGLIEMTRIRQHPWIKWIGIAFFSFFSPAFLANNLELFRIVEALPFFLFGAVLGILVLLRTFGRKKKILILIVLLLFSTALDLFHLTVIYPRFWNSQPASWEKYGKCYELYRAYEILKPLSEQQGPGLLLTEFDSPMEKDPRNKSLVVACYSFDAVRNPAIGSEKARWAAVFAQSYALPFLAERFQNIQPIRLGQDLDRLSPDQDFWMVLLPVNNQTRNILERWAKANALLEKALFHTLVPSSLQFRQDVHRLLLDNYHLFQGDPFLESRFWFDVAEINGYDGNYTPALHAIKNALSFGHAPNEWITISTHFHHKCVSAFIKQGSDYIKVGDYINAKKVLLEANRMESSRAQSPSFMKWLDFMIYLQQGDYINAKQALLEAVRMDKSWAKTPSFMKWIDSMITLQKNRKFPEKDKETPTGDFKKSKNNHQHNASISFI